MVVEAGCTLSAVQAAAAELRIEEFPVRLIYNDPSRSFGGPLDDRDRRLRIYQCTLHEEIIRCAGALLQAAAADLALDESTGHG